MRCQRESTDHRPDFVISFETSQAVVINDIMVANVSCYLLIFILGVLVAGQQESAGQSLDGSVRAAVHWMLGQRRDDYSWGPFTPRAVVALAMAQEAAPLPEGEMALMTKQLNILLSLELDRNSSAAILGLSRLALYVNALYATCQDPRDFHGLNLVEILRSRTDFAPANASRLPVVFVALCLAREVRYDDVHHIIKAYTSHRNKTDLQALSLLALRCIAGHNSSSTLRQHVDSFVDDFQHRFDSIEPDVYTLALALQVLHRGSVDAKSLMAKQSPDGSFGSLLGTYYALPALLGTNVFDAKYRHCSEKSPRDPSMSYPLSDRSAPKVYYSVWLGEGDVRTLTVPLSENRTFFDVMQVAQDRNANFRFSYETKHRGGKHVFSIGSTPNDAQREIYWKLYKTKGEPSGFPPKRSMDPITMDVDNILPAPEDHFIWWFRRHSRGV